MSGDNRMNLKLRRMSKASLRISNCKDFSISLLVAFPGFDAGPTGLSQATVDY